MIKFFRKIRYDLMGENKIGKYLKYAIGEIILVVIGILIALQINNWNIEKNNQQLETKYYKGIIKNLNNDISQLNDLLLKETIRLKALTAIQNSFKDEKLRSNEKSLKNNLFTIHITYDFVCQSNYFDAMKSSGKLNLIRTDSILELIQDYYAFSIKTEEVVATNNKLNAVYIQLGVFPYIDGNSMAQFMFPKEYQVELDAFDNSFFKKNLKNNEVQRFAYALDYMKGGSLNSNASKNNLLTKAEKLKSTLESQLKKK